MQSHCRRKPCTVVANNDHIGAASLLQVPLSEIQKVAQVQVRFFFTLSSIQIGENLRRINWRFGEVENMVGSVVDSKLLIYPAGFHCQTEPHKHPHRYKFFWQLSEYSDLESSLKLSMPLVKRVVLPDVRTCIQM